MRWVPTAGVIANPVPAAPPSAPGATLAIVGGAVAILGSLAIIAACVLPYAHYKDSSAGASYPSVFNPGYPGALWYAAEPAAVILIGIAAAVMLIAVRGRTLRLLATGALLAFGLQTTLLFVGYVASSATGPGSQMGIGGVIGVIGGLAILVGGTLAAAAGLVAATAPKA